jgi:hypothetical protein
VALHKEVYLCPLVGHPSVAGCHRSALLQQALRGPFHGSPCGMHVRTAAGGEGEGGAKSVGWAHLARQLAFDKLLFRRPRLGRTQRSRAGRAKTGGCIGHAEGRGRRTPPVMPV